MQRQAVTSACFRSFEHDAYLIASYTVSAGTFLSAAALVISLLASTALVTGAAGALCVACSGCTRVLQAVGCTTKAVQHCNAMRPNVSSVNSFTMLLTKHTVASNQKKKGKAQF
jgi:uncharacterized membrane protein